MAPDGIDVLNGSLDVALSRLCAAPDADVSEHCGVQLMTIHKAKGLGFEVVIVPALERRPGGGDSPLIAILERVRPSASAQAQADPGQDAGLRQLEQLDEVLVAPLGGRGEQHRTYTWVQSKRRERELGERKRLFYVACTRARRQLHLLGTADISAKGALKPGHGESLLACAWPALAPIFQSAQEASLHNEAPAAAHGKPVLVPAWRDSQSPEPGRLERLAAAGTLPAETLDSSALRLSRVPPISSPSFSSITSRLMSRIMS